MTRDLKNLADRKLNLVFVKQQENALEEKKEFISLYKQNKKSSSCQIANLCPNDRSEHNASTVYYLSVWAVHYSRQKYFTVGVIFWCD